MKRRLAMTLAFIYAGIFTCFALLSGSWRTEGSKGFLANLPNMLPWLLVWGAFFSAWKKPATGAVLFLGLAAAATIFFHTYRWAFPFLLITAPLIIIASLLLLDPEKERETTNR